MKIFQSKVEDDNWLNWFSGFAKKEIIRNSHVARKAKAFYGNVNFKVIYQSETLAKIYPFKKPAILLLSHPRSGSSWIGKILSFSPDIAYLREPITQALLQKLNYKKIIINPSNSDFKKDYKYFADQAFAGIPTTPPVINNLPDFFHRSRSGKHLFIKEVNPLAASFFSRHYSPKILILLRHPAGIVDSFMRMGWLHDNFEDFSYCYAKRMTKAVQGSQRVSCKILIYEDIAKNPREEFSKLFNFIGVGKPAEFSKIIDEYCKQIDDKWKPYHTKRSSDHEVDKWKRNLNKEIIEAVKKGYFRSELNYYRGERDWEY